MRHYPADSPEAMARIIAHTLMVDGVVDSSELKLLAHRDVIARIGLEDEAFDKVFYQYCEDLLRSAQRMQNGKLELDANTVEHLLAEIQHPALQEVLVSTMLDIVNADRRLTSSEAGLIAQALKQWQLDILEISGRQGSELPARPRPTH